jgi:hypothetical protein
VAPGGPVGGALVWREPVAHVPVATDGTAIHDDDDNDDERDPEEREDDEQMAEKKFEFDAFVAVRDSAFARV